MSAYMAAIVRKPVRLHLSIRDIRMLIATCPMPRALARRKRIRPCRPWIRFARAPAPHSPQPACTPLAGSSDCSRPCGKHRISHYFRQARGARQ
ncbi:hypothetical protein FVE88_05990 [Ectopseudomonas mendocina]|nr:hypothetical protein FVE88_05990 [Pseudomonas mendocina]